MLFLFQSHFLKSVRFTHCSCHFYLLFVKLESVAGSLRKESVVFLRYYEAGFHYVFPVPMETNIDGGKYDANVVYMMHSYLNFRLESL